MHDSAVPVADDLHLDMAGALDQLFEIDLVLAERRLRLALAFGDFALKLRLGPDGAHAAPAAAPGGFQHQRIADLQGELLDFAHVVGQRLGRRHHRHADGDRQIARRHLVAELAHRVRRRADESDAGLGAGFGEFRAFRQKPVAGMDRVGARKFGDADDLGDRQIGLDRPHILGEMRAAADLVALVRLEPVQRQLVFLGPDGDGLHAELIGGAEDADGDFGAVGDKNLGNLHSGTPEKPTQAAGIERPSAIFQKFLARILLQCK